MSAPEFLDTNILVYAYDDTDLKKQKKAQELVEKAIAQEMAVSTQVLAEFAATLLYKLSPAVRPEDVIEILDALEALKLVTPDAGIVRRAVEAHRVYKLHFYDAMIVAAAERAGCGRIWSEDLNHSQKYFGIVVSNPFA
jgi:predicted nucleic acid-binding protein